jgi:dihydrofolate synthase/folylpolyglutamate synthase
MEVIEKVCREKDVPLIKVGEDVTWVKGEHSYEGQHFRVKGLKGSYDLWIPLLGEYQVENAATAVAAVELLTESGAVIKSEAITEGLAKVHWPGRLQVLGREPLVIVDGAHNAYSMRRLGQALEHYFKFEKVKLILGFGVDKDIAGMAREAAGITGDIVLVASRHPRSVKADVLAAEFRKQGVTPRVAETVREAIRLALDEAGHHDLVCAAGSIFVIAEVMEFFGQTEG